MLRFSQASPSVPTLTGWAFAVAAIAAVLTLCQASSPALARVAPRAATTTAYAQAVLADQPTVYYRLDESAGPIAADSSGNGHDATYQAGVQFGATGALLGEADSAITTTVRNVVVTQSGLDLPAGNTARTLETWVNYACCSAAIDLMRYGDVAGGHGFEVALADNADSIVVTAGAGSVNASQVGDFRHGWHLIDVTYDGSAVQIYQDGQLIGGGTLGAAGTVTPGQGLQLTSNASGMGLDETAVYPTALSATRIDAHWTAGQSTTGTPVCTAVPTQPYPAAVLADSPLMAFRLDELGLNAQGRVAIDYSSNCRNAAYQQHPTSVPGALTGDPDPGLGASARDVALTQSGNALPAGSAARTLEAWVNYACCNAAFDLLRYGDVAGGHGFEVQIADNGGSIVVTAGAASVSASPVGDFQHGWHMLAVTYDGSGVDIYQDGQIIGVGTLGSIATVTPGSGLRVATNAAGAGLDEVAAYGAALPAQRINAHFQASTHAITRVPANTAPPSISGTATVGSKLSESSGVWDNAPTSFSYQWQDCDAAGDACADIAGAASQVYTLTAGDAGHTIRVEEFATNSAGTAGPATSAATAVVAAAPVGPIITIKQIKAALAQVLAPRKGTRIGHVVKAGGVTLSFPAPSGGRLVIGWYLVPKGAHLSRSTKPKVVLVAHAARTISAARSVAVKVKLTSRGRALLKHARRITLTAKASFTVPGRATVTARRAFTVKR